MDNLFRKSNMTQPCELSSIVLNMQDERPRTMRLHRLKREERNLGRQFTHRTNNVDSRSKYTEVMLTESRCDEQMAHH
jgi:hypothetical protein